MSNGKQEMIADIIAEMRRFGNRHWMHDEGQNVRMFADRLEAAWKREKAEIETSALAAGGMVEASRYKQVGNAAAMREALEAIRDEAYERIIDGLATDADWLYKTAKSALSAPSRNCDRLSADQCKKMFEHEMGIYLTKEATDRDREIARCTAYGVIDALYAERKGESDGK